MKSISNTTDSDSTDNNSTPKYFFKSKGPFSKYIDSFVTKDAKKTAMHPDDNLKCNDIVEAIQSMSTPLQYIQTFASKSDSITDIANDESIQNNENGRHHDNYSKEIISASTLKVPKSFQHTSFSGANDIYSRSVETIFCNKKYQILDLGIPTKYMLTRYK